MSRAKRRRVDTPAPFTFYVPEDEEPNVSYRHVVYESGRSGLRRSTHAVQLPSCPSQSAAQDMYTWNDECTTDEQNSPSSDPLPDPGNFGDLDIAYIQELAELELDGRKKRNRTAAVS
ncbi:hypothetical protein AB1N83_014436 [Pleurotus pulmonarius]|nr:hypothetical protein EYR38_010827 [Pleurotus pulmonarius]